MSFLKDFKEEISQAVNELVSSDDTSANKEETLVNENNVEETVTSQQSVLEDANLENQKEDMTMGRQTKKSKEKTNESFEETLNNDLSNDDQMVNTLDEDALNDNIDMAVLNELFGKDSEEEKTVNEENKQSYETDTELEKELAKEINSDDLKSDEETDSNNSEISADDIKAALRGNKIVNDNTFSEESPLVSEDVAEVTKGTMIDGNIISEGSMNVYGKIKGNVACRGKLVVSGTIVGASRAAEIYTSNAKIDGDVTSDGSIKVGNGSIIIGNIYGTSAVIAGAVQGDVDVHGPVIIDGTAVIQGNIRSRSVQVNNGAAIEGMISQCYAEIDYAALFDKTFAK